MGVDIYVGMDVCVGGGIYVCVGVHVGVYVCVGVGVCVGSQCGASGQVNCSAIFKTNPTDRGMCCTFNALAAEEIYRWTDQPNVSF